MEKSQPPKISIITPSFNQAKFLEDTILSVINQDYPRLEFIIIDGGSTDGSVAIIKKYEKHLAYWVSENDRGQSHAIHKGFEKASGELFGWLNSDDRFVPGALHAIAEKYMAEGGSCAVVGIGRGVDQRGRTLYTRKPESLTFESILKCNDEWILQPTCLFPASSFRAVGGLDENLHYAMDFDLFVKLRKCIRFVACNKEIAIALCHPKAKTKARRGRMFAEVRLIQIRHGGEEYALDALERDYAKLLWFQEKMGVFKKNPLYRLLRRCISLPFIGSK